MKPIAYFSMEIGVDPHLPTYSGGLGVLAGDTLKSAADLGIPMVGITLLYKKGYFHQNIDKTGKQVELPVSWSIEDYLKPVNAVVTITIEGQPVKIKCWRYDIKGIRGHIVPVFFLDTNVPQNANGHQNLTDSLYGGDERYRLCQEAILGLGGIELLMSDDLKAKENISDIAVFHMNEGHAALLTIALLDKQAAADESQQRIDEVRKKCIFTTHTPVPAGHDVFDVKLVEQVLGRNCAHSLKKLNLIKNNQLNMTDLALEFSRYVNGVAKRHGEVSRTMFPQRMIQAITNGIHTRSWVSPSFAHLYDEYIPLWRYDPFYLRFGNDIAVEHILSAHKHAKQELCQLIKDKVKESLKPELFTIGFARRAAIYKRADLVFSDLDRLEKIAKQFGGLQFVFAGKAHPKDFEGKRLIENIFQVISKFSEECIKIIYLENYDMALGKVITAGVDLWLNNPVKPLEASGTSGMKAALNGVPSLSTYDGWWVEGLIEGVTGWEIEDNLNGNVASDLRNNNAQAARSLYDKLEHVILPLYHHNQHGYGKVMRNTIAVNASYFHTHRMLLQYLYNAYLAE